MNKNIYVSTGGFGAFTVEEAVNDLFKEGISKIELSGGRCGCDTLKFLKRYKKMGCNFVLHNYFPAPIDDPFVLNLGSPNLSVRRKSRELVQSALIWSNELESNFYALHAPFRLDPSIENLGNGFPQSKLSGIEATLDIFYEEFLRLSDLGKRYGVEIAIENNVLSLKDFNTFGYDNPFFFTGSDIDILSNYSNAEIHYLLDFGHLKVSAASLDFDPHRVVDKIKEKIKWCHLSDNDGTKDSNCGFNQTAWFMDHIKTMNVPLTIEVYKQSAGSLRQIQNDLAKLLFCDNYFQ